jgi:hypothetical protein
LLFYCRIALIIEKYLTKMERRIILLVEVLFYFVKSESTRVPEDTTGTEGRYLHIHFRIKQHGIFILRMPAVGDAKARSRDTKWQTSLIIKKMWS